MDLIEKKISSEEIYNGVIVHLFNDKVLLPNGKIACREVIRHCGATAIVPINEKNEVIMVRQFRYPFNRVTLEIPAGKIDKNEDKLVCAIRELSEETGVSAEEFIYLGQTYSCPAILDEILHLYIARGLNVGSSHTDEDEFINTETIPIEKLMQMVKNNEIKDGKTQIGLLKSYLYLKENGLL